jgi:hypothetical protein
MENFLINNHHLPEYWTATPIFTSRVVGGRYNGEHEECTCIMVDAFDESTMTGFIP